ncbi:MAG: type II toxin-antitoxin system VapC family toxin [Sciscionella sp.]|nr:type II toxin-antitoxin system VapC family toxin [Sciscionella sp.]
MIVIDASAAVSGLLHDGRARRLLAEERVHAPHLIDSEVASALRRKVSAGQLVADVGSTVLQVWQRLGVTRHPTVAMLGRLWELRENVSAYDASYVALAEALDCPLVTADGRLARAPGLRCPITVVPN